MELRSLRLAVQLLSSAVLVSALQEWVRPPCVDSAAAVRKEWGELTKGERRDYINAIHCMRRIPSGLGLPATTSLYDDFAAMHINNTLAVHSSGTFLSWHRHHVALWEAALRDECDYKGAQPYWNWALYAGRLEESPLLDGSETSLSGNGLPIPDRPPQKVGGATLPIGSGGGCVTTGPFANMTITMGPYHDDHMLPPDWADSKPHCLYRDFNNWASLRYTNQTGIDYMYTLQTIADFQDAIHNPGVEKGVHTGGHYAVGGVMFDLFASSQDPMFYLHHAMVDRVWATWQAQGAQNRRYTYDGTNTIYNGDATAPAANDTLLDFGILGRPMTLEQIADPMGGEYCYRYT